MNRLARERSPVSAAARATIRSTGFRGATRRSRRRAAEDKPIFLSIGYSTCHWCHVMEHESFENDAVAAVLNEHFVAIKVDREERPDVDRVYMTFVQATTGSGGWPMSVWLTPELKPFYGGTYFPPSSKWGRPGFVEILQEIARVWSAERDKVDRVGRGDDRAAAQRWSRRRRRPSVPGAAALEHDGVSSSSEAFDCAQRRLRRRAEVSAAVRAAVPAARARAHRATQSRATWCCARCGRWRSAACAITSAAASTAIRSTRRGGCRISRRCSTTRRSSCSPIVEAAQVSGDPFYVEVAEDTLRYVMREMTDAGGGFYSAEDADSVPPEHADDPSAHKTEGAFYLWRADEIDALLGADAAIVKLRFGIEPDGNAPQDPQQEFTGKNLLYVAAVDRRDRQGDRPAGRRSRRRAAARAADDVRGAARPAAAAARRQGATAWNGLMIAAFARTGAGAAGLRRRRPRRRRAVSRRGAARGGVRPRADVERAIRRRCCAGIATGTPRSTATPRTTPT